MLYSADFRLCVVRNIESGMSWEEARRIFSISPDTLRRWLRSYRESGTMEGAVRKPYPHRKVDKTQLLALLEAHPDATLEELAEPFGVAHSVIDYHLRKLGITRKKNHAICGAGRAKKTRIPSQNQQDGSGGFGLSGRVRY
jgi:transposase